MKPYFILIILVFLNLSSSEDLFDDADQSGYLSEKENLVDIEKTDQNNTCEGFRCKDNHCISSNLTCNGIPDCPDYSDEDSCPDQNNTCEGFRCKDNLCISSSLTCNGIPDCPDHSDEDSCPAALPVCEKGQYSCDDGTCISRLWRCDGESDCSNGSDEKNCNSTSCVPDEELRCGNGQCLPLHWACDGSKDCYDGTDEEMCSVKKICDLTEFKCGDGLCIQKNLVCNQKQDCADGSDEKNCSQACKEVHYQCNDRATCIYIHEVCDQHIDCPDGDDEVNCTAKKICDLTEFKCGDGLCINKTLVCNQKQDCADGSDEKNCSQACKEFHYQCKDRATCIYTHEVCDRHIDCPDGDDEVNCTRVGSQCNSDEYFCINNSRCISKKWICDGDDDCGDGADEMNCSSGLKPIISSHAFWGCKEFFCNVSAECVSWSKVCDGHSDCKDMTDEGGMCSRACAENHGRCSQVCQKTPQGSKCSCYDGYTLSPDNFTCEDVNECDIPGRCSQFCNNTEGGFTCSCAEGYFLDHEQKCKAIDGPATLMYLLPDEIKGIELSTHLQRVYVNDSRGDFRGFDYDASLGIFFWSDWRKSTINSYTLSNSTQQVLFTTQNRPEYIRWDWIQENLYFVDVDGSIVLCSKIGDYCSTVVAHAATHISSFAISPIKGFMFWSVWNVNLRQNKGIIERAELDGSHRIIIVNEGLVWPSAMTIDHVMEMIYWVDSKIGVMESTDFNGFKRRIVISDGMYYPFSMAIFEDFVFWSDWGEDSIIRCDKYSGKNCSHFHRGNVKSEVLMVVHKGYQQKGENRCLNHECPQLCSPTRTSFVCKCDDDYSLVNGTCEAKTKSHFSEVDIPWHLMS